MENKGVQEKIKEIEKEIEILKEHFENYREISNYTSSKNENTLFFLERKFIAIFDYLCSKDSEFKKIYIDMIKGSKNGKRT